MSETLPVARPGDVCILVEPDVNELPQLRRLQRQLWSSFGGHLQERVHFTCQRFALPALAQLPTVVDQLRVRLATVQPLTVSARRLELVQHPFWEVCVLRWDLQLGREMFCFARQVEAALAASGLTPHYPPGDAWRPHVTALEAIPAANGIRVNGAHAGQFLYTGRRVVLSQLREGKRFKILATVELKG